MFNLTSEIITEYLQKQLSFNKLPALSLQEEMIIQCVIKQETYEQIAASLYISPGTVRNIASQLFQKLSALFDCKVTKKNFLLIIHQIIKNQGHQTLDWPVESLTKNQPNALKILLIDDQLENLLLLKTILSEQHYQVYALKSGKTALTLIANIKPDLILLDILMPDLSGYEVCKSLKQDPQFQEIPIIFLSAASELTDKVKAFNLGACDYITKPFEAVEVLARVSYQLELRSQRQALKEEIQAHQITIESLQQSRSILASLLNNIPYGIAALEAIRSPQTGDIIDFRFMLANPIFTAFFPDCSPSINHHPSCAKFFRDYELDWLTPLINLVSAGQPFQATIAIADQTIEVKATKLGDGVSLMLMPITQRLPDSFVITKENNRINS